MRPSALLLFAALCGSLSSCIVGGACTTIGCVNGVRIDWSGRATGDRLAVVADGVRYEITCPASSSGPLWCDPDGVRFEGRPTSLRVEVTTSNGVRSGTFTPTYRTSTPNGPDCGPVCYQATVTVM
ncbi:MAG: hypothetical protein U0326_22310 [Polyangiales bacterium]